MKRPSATVSLYFGLDQEGIDLKKRLDNMVIKRKSHSLSALIREYAEIGLIDDERKVKGEIA